MFVLLYCFQKNHIYTSGASGTNAAVIRGALRAEKPELLTVILPQSLRKQPPESQELLSKVCFFLYLYHSKRWKVQPEVARYWIVDLLQNRAY